jgi:serine/threonine protein kinase
MSSNLLGRVLFDQFRVDAFIASGGMGAVYRVWDLKRNVPLAMKVLHAELAEDPLIIKRFQREARALKKLAHPNIVPFYGLFQTSDIVFLLEHFIDGPNLKQILQNRQGKPMPIQEALIYLKALCAALGYAHANGVVHCDVKPGNVMLDEGGNIYLTDFGIARHAESTTTTLATVGTAAYMASEQIRGESLSPQTDIYALGVMLFEMLTGGKRPFTGEHANTTGTTSEKVRWEQVHLNPPSPRQFNPDISPELAAVILRCLDKEVHNRFKTTSELYKAILMTVSDTEISGLETPLQKTSSITYPYTQPELISDTVKKTSSKAQYSIDCTYSYLGIIIDNHLHCDYRGTPWIHNILPKCRTNQIIRFRTSINHITSRKSHASYKYYEDTDRYANNKTRITAV